LEAPCSPGGATVRLSAIHIRYSPTCLAARANERLRLVFDNRDAGVRHNVHVLPGPRGYDTNPPPLFVGPIVKGKKTVIYTISSLPAGLLSFQCDIHTVQMRGLFAVAPVVSPATGSIGMGFVVSWATSADAPPGYVFDVQIRRPGSASFSDWRTHQTGYQATYIPDAPGTYSFRVSVYPANGELRPIGYSPAASIEVT
jgi:hypothetical protein